MEQTWVLDPPARMFYDSKYAKILNQQDNRFNGELIILILLTVKCKCIFPKK